MTKSDAERCAEYEKFKIIDATFRAGDLAALRAAVDDPDIVPNGPMPLTIGPCLAYAIYHSSLQFIRSLLEIGADPNPEDHSGFPPLIAALSCSRPQPGSPARADVLEIVKLLLSFKADPNQRGINDTRRCIWPSANAITGAGAITASRDGSAVSDTNR